MDPRGTAPPPLGPQGSDQKNPDTAPLCVSQVVEGGKGATFYLSSLRPSMGGFDHNPTMKDLLGDEAFKKLQQMVADTYETSGTD